MEDKIKKWLVDIIDSIEEVESYLIDNEKNFNKFLSDRKTVRAVERNIEIIGEALNRIRKEKPELEILNTHKIIATRNKIAHEYDKIDEAILWELFGMLYQN